jgi:transposase
MRTLGEPIAEWTRTNLLLAVVHGSPYAAPKYKSRQPRPTAVAAFEPYLRQRVAAWPDLSSARLLREVREQGYQGGKTALYDFLRTVRPPPTPVFEVRFETPAGQQAQADFAEFKVNFGSRGPVRKV